MLSFLCSSTLTSIQITADGDCSHEIKRCLLLGRKAMTHLDSILKSRGIILLTKVCLAKAMVFKLLSFSKLFSVALGLHCGFLWLCWAGSHFGGFSCCGAPAVEPGLRSCGAQASLPLDMRNLPWLGTEPMYPALAGGFLATGPPGMSKLLGFRKLTHPAISGQYSSKILFCCFAIYLLLFYMGI